MLTNNVTRPYRQDPPTYASQPVELQDYLHNHFPRYPEILECSRHGFKENREEYLPGIIVHVDVGCSGAILRGKCCAKAAATKGGKKDHNSVYERGNHRSPQFTLSVASVYPSW